MRARAAIALAALSLALSVSLALFTYQIARTYLIKQRDALVLHQAGLNARALNGALGRGATDITQRLVSLSASGNSDAMAKVNETWYESGRLRPRDLPPRLAQLAFQGRPSSQRVSLRGTTTMIVGIPLTNAQGAYFELAPLDELERTLGVLAWSLVAAAAFTAVLGALVGLYASRRLLRPLRTFSIAATRVAGGQLDTRLDLSHDPDLAAFGEAFNHMALTLQERLERDERFAADVSHELRNPLTALTAAVDVLEVRADARSAPAVRVLREQVERFRGLVIDLLELHQLEAGASPLELDLFDPVACVREIVRPLPHDVCLVADEHVPDRVALDRRRVERVLANLIENAERHGGGTTMVAVSGDSAELRIAVEDSGPGVPPDERGRVFDRFHKGRRSAIRDGGLGLGLAIAAEQCRVHHGSLEIEDRAGGGARFVATFRGSDR